MDEAEIKRRLDEIAARIVAMTEAGAALERQVAAIESHIAKLQAAAQAAATQLDATLTQIG